MGTERPFLLGMKTPIIEGDEKFIPYFELVQTIASEQGKIFFLDSGEGRDFETDSMEGEDLSGWLIDKDKAAAFIPQWLEGWDAIDDAFVDDFVFAKWHLDDGVVSIEFKDTRCVCWWVPERRREIMAAKKKFLQGMKTPVIEGDEKFIPYFELVQKTASEQGKIFFLDTGQARDFETDDMYGEDLSGWLIDKEKIAVFEPQWLEGWDAIDDSWFDDFVWAVWHLDDGAITIEFEKV